MPIEKSPPAPKQKPDSKEKDISPYWSGFTAAISPHLWLPILADQESPDTKSSKGMPGTTETGSWFQSTWTNAPKGKSQSLFPKDFTFPISQFTESAATPTQARKIRVYPTKDQRQILKLWFDSARWCYNETAARLKADPQLRASWKALKTDIINAVPQRLKEAPYQVKSIAVRDACKAMSDVKRRNKELGPGLPAEEYHQLGFRSRKAPKQGCYIPKTAVTEFGAYFTILGNLRMTENLPEQHGDSRLTLHNGQYHLAVTMPARRHPGETQARVVALDPGIRNFLTWFSETSTGHIAPRDFGRIQRLCQHLDDLLSPGQAGAEEVRQTQQVPGRRQNARQNQKPD